MSTFFLFPHANLAVVRLLTQDVAESPRRFPVRIRGNAESVFSGESLTGRRQLCRRVVLGRRGSNHVVVRAGPPSNTTLIFAFVFPLSLLAITVLNAIRIADKLDEKFLEEQAINQAIMEEEEEEDDHNENYVDGVDDDAGERKHAKLVPEKSVPVGRSRNRPKRVM